MDPETQLIVAACLVLLAPNPQIRRSARDLVHSIMLEHDMTAADRTVAFEIAAQFLRDLVPMSVIGPNPYV